MSGGEALGRPVHGREVLAANLLPRPGLARRAAGIREAWTLPATAHSWSRMEEEEEKCNSHQCHDSDEKMERALGGPDVREVSEETHKILTSACTRSVSNKAQWRSWDQCPVLKVQTTKSPNLDPFMRSGVPSKMNEKKKQTTGKDPVVRPGFLRPSPPTYCPVGARGGDISRRGEGGRINNCPVNWQRKLQTVTPQESEDFHLYEQVISTFSEGPTRTLWKQLHTYLEVTLPGSQRNSWTR